MLDFFQHIDNVLFKLINKSLAGEGLDSLMIAASNKFIWIQLYIYFIYLLINKFGKKGWFYVLALILTVASADLISSKIFKPGFKRVRPCNETYLNARIPDGKSSSYGFVSSHAANHAAIAAFLIVVLGALAWRRMALIAWAVIICYSRIYLGKHYFFDVFCGALLGVLLAYFWLNVLKYFLKRQIEITN